MRFNRPVGKVIVNYLKSDRHKKEKTKLNKILLCCSSPPFLFLPSLFQLSCVRLLLSNGASLSSPFLYPRSSPCPSPPLFFHPPSFPSSCLASGFSSPTESRCRLPSLLLPLFPLPLPPPSSPSPLSSSCLASGSSSPMAPRCRLPAIWKDRLPSISSLG